jgi:hypothetical protein
MLHLAAVEARAASTCVADCTQTACTVGCDEGEVRDAVAKANDCLNKSEWTGRTITIDAGTPACTISMLNDVTMANAYPNSSAGDPDRTRCASRTTGSGAGGCTFLYVGTGQCRSAAATAQNRSPPLRSRAATIPEDFTVATFQGLHSQREQSHRRA